jgi:hypothetical protein
MEAGSGGERRWPCPVAGRDGNPPSISSLPVPASSGTGTGTGTGGSQGIFFKPFLLGFTKKKSLSYQVGRRSTKHMLGFLTRWAVLTEQKSWAVRSYEPNNISFFSWNGCSVFFSCLFGLKTSRHSCHHPSSVHVGRFTSICTPITAASSMLSRPQ